MTKLWGFLVALWLSFMAVMVPRGMYPAMPEFWLTPWLYGTPLMLLAWPLYLTVFKGLRSSPWWILSAIGGLLAPIPFFVLIIGTDALNWSFLSPERPVSYYFPWRSVFTVWYALFGLIFGAWVGLTRHEKPKLAG